ncbi:MAG: hypothetical protein RBT05_11075 [Bacteroidales bacterium]|nr:hypothetical protein [Bacteroidales bacterium]
MIIMMMTLFKARYSKIVFLSIITLFCFVDANSQNFAKEFLSKQNDSISQDVIYLYITPTLTYRNESLEKMPNFSDLEQDVQKDLLDKYAPLYYKAKDSILLSLFSENLNKTLAALGFKVIKVDAVDKLPINIDETHHTLNVAQMEIEEFSFNDSLVYEGNDREVFYKLINGVSFNTWFIYNEADSNSRLVFYNEEKLEDFFSGEIRLIDDELIATYDYDKIKEEDAYSVAKQNAISSSQYFFNFLMNKYVWINSSGIDIYYYGIDVESKKIYSDTEPFDNFDLIDYK